MTSNSNSVYTKKTQLRFGKYKGQTVAEILDFDPSYLVWCHNTISWFKLDKVTFDYAVDKANQFEEERAERRFRNRVWRYLRPQDPGECPYWFEDDNGSWLS